MDQDLISLISHSTGLQNTRVAAVLKLMNEGATIPFLARYRKEVTGGMDEVVLAELATAKKRFEELIARKITILETIRSQGKLSPELEKKINETWDSVILEDIYLPYKPKRKTRADTAREKGLEPLAKQLMSQGNSDPEQLALRFINSKVESIEDALQGARDIIAEWIHEMDHVRQLVRYSFERSAEIISKVSRGKSDEGIKYKDYYEFSERLSRCPSHRILAIFRGEDEGFLKVSIHPDEERLLNQLHQRLIKGRGDCSMQVEMALEDSYKRLLQPSIETEFRAAARKKADEEAISIFAENLRQLLLAAPLGNKPIMGIDPGFRTGCKVVCLNAYGDLVWNGTIYPHPPQLDGMQAAKTISDMVQKYKIEAIAVGNGTAGRETIDFCKGIRGIEHLEIYSVSEAGASIYSASDVAREEFPELDLTVRGAVSIGRRLMDPLAELVKIDAKHIGVGQYQHDVDQGMLREKLDRVVESCVHAVGINLHTASKHLLAYVSGLGPSLAATIVQQRTENGPFESRAALLKVPRLGPKAFEQCAGFLRIPDAKNPLDNSAVHPERYSVVSKMAKDQGVPVEEFITNPALRKGISLEKYIDKDLGMPTLHDIMKELEKPGLDPRGVAETFEFSSVRKMEDLEPGMQLNGIVTNLAQFGAFVDIGVKQDGMIHISQITDKFIKSPSDVLQLGQQVRVRVVEVDVVRKRVSLSMKGVS
jgi:uncharacterized protein